MISKLLFEFGCMLVRLSNKKLLFKVEVFGGLVQETHFDETMISYDLVDYDVLEEGLCSHCFMEIDYEKYGDIDVCPFCGEGFYES